MARSLFVPIAVLVVLVGCGDLGLGPDWAIVSGEPDVDDPEAHLFQLVNQHRKAVGCESLVWDSQLAGVAEAYSEDMAERNFFGHVDPDGRGLRYRLATADVEFRLAAENLGRGFEGREEAQQALDAWLESPSHRKNLEDCRFHRTGLGLRDSHWTHIFAI